MAKCGRGRGPFFIKADLEKGIINAVPNVGDNIEGGFFNMGSSTGPSDEGGPRADCPALGHLSHQRDCRRPQTAPAIFPAVEGAGRGVHDLQIIGAPPCHLPRLRAYGDLP
ncbi:hypothetical protein CRG98_031185 [Punica granatum]|uniref:Uncharacterized protein n=1 Tax=Punica granatum TaxID=22663 RepID=A0A2I0IXF8_PUNGR|nr:hypothetical protein CRG98_031185 [Punica granatum]